MYWPVGKTWCHRTAPSAEDWEGLMFHTFYLPASYCHYKWCLGPIEKHRHSQLILPFREQEARKKWELPAMSPTRSKEKSSQVLQGISLCLTHHFYTCTSPVFCRATQRWAALWVMTRELRPGPALTHTNKPQRTSNLTVLNWIRIHSLLNFRLKTVLNNYFLVIPLCPATCSPLTVDFF